MTFCQSCEGTGYSYHMAWFDDIDICKKCEGNGVIKSPLPFPRLKRLAIFLSGLSLYALMIYYLSTHFQIGPR